MVWLVVQCVQAYPSDGIHGDRAIVGGSGDGRGATGSDLNDSLLRHRYFGGLVAAIGVPGFCEAVAMAGENRIGLGAAFAGGGSGGGSIPLTIQVSVFGQLRAEHRGVPMRILPNGGCAAGGCPFASEALAWDSSPLPSSPFSCAPPSEPARPFDVAGVQLAIFAGTECQQRNLERECDRSVLL